MKEKLMENGGVRYTITTLGDVFVTSSFRFHKNTKQLSFPIINDRGDYVEKWVNVVDVIKLTREAYVQTDLTELLLPSTELAQV